MKKVVAAMLLLLPGCWWEEVEIRALDMGPEEAVSIVLKSEEPLWVTFEAPEDLDYNRLSRTCPVLEDGISDQAMCAEIAQVAPDGTAITLIRGVIGAGLKFTPVDGELNLRFTNFSSRAVTYQLKIEPGD